MLWLLPGLQMQPVSQALTFEDDAKSAAVNQIMALLTCLYLWVINPPNKQFLPGNAGKRSVGFCSCSALWQLSSGCSFVPTNSHRKCEKCPGKGWAWNSIQIHPSKIIKDKAVEAGNTLWLDGVCSFYQCPMADPISSPFCPSGTHPQRKSP